ncbi:hypothetical protein [Chelatococcus reniformis]|uniref:Uncharacterized protein n=1 Tax=Chelatococcus reniformis TaxID=1494448 RepID=A0A916UGS8_9HYPH|nr:hypothetical protein [Chelatococcus reniformis]GGC72090.1 hypothetical protein GCM10010994_33130 [Chelatococcus reniformis]
MPPRLERRIRTLTWGKQQRRLEIGPRWNENKSRTSNAGTASHRRSQICPSFACAAPWADSRDKDDWLVIDEHGECIGRIYWHREAPPGVAAWSWQIGLWGRAHRGCRVDSLKSAKAAAHSAWNEMRPAITPAEYEAARDDRRRHAELVRFQDRRHRILYVATPDTYAAAEVRIEELHGCLEGSAEAMELDQLTHLVGEWLTYIARSRR